MAVAALELDLFAELVDLAVDAGAGQGELARFWPVGAVGGLVALGFFTRSGLSSTR